LEIYSFEVLPSTQHFLIDQLALGAYRPPVAVLAFEQHQGIGSRDNHWSGGKGNFFASFALLQTSLPADLPLGSASIYFAYVMKKVLKVLGESVWLKWPNDLYRDTGKVGGVITQMRGGVIICGIGINLTATEGGYPSLQSTLQPLGLLKRYVKALAQETSWKDIFREYQIEFEQSRKYTVHVCNQKKSLQDAILCTDGSISIDGERIFGLR
jgi:BirA family transcriptional regulator, biotin operon repressor / biotin---[acetyl-CoA-carboxylase] ligase